MVEPESYSMFIFPFAASSTGNCVHSSWGTDVVSLICVTRYSSAGRGCLGFAWSVSFSLLLPVDSDSCLRWRCLFLSLSLSSRGFLLCSGVLILFSDRSFFFQHSSRLCPLFLHAEQNLFMTFVRGFSGFGKALLLLRQSRPWCPLFPHLKHLALFRSDRE